MKRWAVRVCVLLLLGAIVNVAVALLVPTISTGTGGWHFRMGWPSISIHRDFGKYSMGWPGFAINTVFYAAVLWGMFAGLSTARRRWRRGRGLCPKCAYDLRAALADSNACPECGAPR